MMIAKRFMQFASRRALPYDSEVEYLESSGTQYIDTGFYPTGASAFDVSGEFTVATATSTRFGARVGYANKCFAAMVAGNQIRLDHGANMYYYTPTTTITTRLVLDGVNLTAQAYDSAGELSWSTSISAQSFSTGHTVMLFALNNNGTVNGLGSMKISACKLYESGVLALDLIPVRVGTVGYMYDRVSATLFGNAGSGAFSYGSDI